MSYREALNKPLLIDFNGNENKQLNFDYDDGVTVYGGCGASLHGIFWYFGGRYSNDKRQVISKFKVKWLDNIDCRPVRLLDVSSFVKTICCLILMVVHVIHLTIQNQEFYSALIFSRISNAIRKCEYFKNNQS